MSNTKTIDSTVQHLRKPSKPNIQEKPPTLLKNVQVASTSGGHTQSNIKGTGFCSRNNANTFKLNRTITNALRNTSDPSRHFVNLSKHSFSFDT